MHPGSSAEDEELTLKIRFLGVRAKTGNERNLMAGSAKELAEIPH